MAQMTLKIKKVGMKNPKTKVLGFASRAIANGTHGLNLCVTAQARQTATSRPDDFLSRIRELWKTKND